MDALRALQRSSGELGGRALLRSGADVARTRERARRGRITRLGLLVAAVGAVEGVRLLTGSSVMPGLPNLDGFAPYVPAVILIMILGSATIIPLAATGRSPHVLYRPGQVDTRLDDVKGAGMVVEEAVKTLNLFLAHKTFRERMGGTARRGILFEGPPGTGKTYLAKAMAAEAGVPFLFVSSTAFQSQLYGAASGKLRAFFRALRKAASARRRGPKGVRSASSRRSTRLARRAPEWAARVRGSPASSTSC
jgi:cell division protease FtsH